MYNLKKDIEDALKKHPALQLVETGDKLRVRGTFMAHKEHIEIEPYEIEIRFPVTYPYSFPWVFEVSDKIWPKDATRHVNTTGTLCLGNPFDEAKVCKLGINLIWFLENILNPHLCREYAREKLGTYITGERSHGLEGIWESFYEIYGTTDKKEIVTEMDIALHKKKPARNSLCYCGRRIKYKHCHEKKHAALLQIDRSQAEIIFQTLKKSIS